MNLKDYLNKRIEDLQDGPCNSSLVQGKMLAFEEILSKLPEMEHEVTLREVKEECKDCVFCPFCADDDLNCMFKQTPEHWDIDDIQKRMKEARND